MGFLVQKITRNFSSVWMLAILFSTVPAHSMIIGHCKNSFTRTRANITHAHEHNGSPKVLLKLCNNDIEKFQKLLKHEKLIRTVLSKYKELSAITVIADDSVGDCYIDYDKNISLDNSKEKVDAHDWYIGLHSNWFEAAEDEKQFLLAHEAAHLACRHWNRSTIESYIYKYHDPLVFFFSHVSFTSAGLALLLAEIIFHGTPGDCSANLEYGLYLEKCLALAWIGSRGSLLVIRFSLKASRQNEQEADLMAVKKLETAEGAIKWCEKSLRLRNKLPWHTFEIQSFTHPPIEQRIAYLKQWQSGRE